MRRYIPRKGDVIALTFDPQSGHEQKGRRPALVVSNDLFNRHTGLAIACPLTRTNRGIPFHVPVTDTPSVAGFIMVEQVKSIDYRARGAEYIAPASPETLDAVLAILDACIF
jgi:mRNA interferase MazF